MLSTPLDAFIFVSILASLIFFAAIYTDKPVLAIFSGLVAIYAFVCTYIYSRIPTLNPLVGVCIIVVGVWLDIFLMSIYI